MQIHHKHQIQRTAAQEYYNEECIKSGSDKACLNHTFAGYNYMDHYAMLFAQSPVLRNPTSDVRIMELGVLGGNSLRLWRTLFPNSTIVGVDSTPDIKNRIGVVSGKTHVYSGDQADTDLLMRMHDLHGPFDLVIDDGSHAYSDMLTTAIALLPRLRHGGLYVIEDINVGWPLPEWPGMQRSKYPPNSQAQLYEFLNEIMTGISMRSGPALSLHFYHGLIAFQRADSGWSPGESAA